MSRSEQGLRISNVTRSFSVKNGTPRVAVDDVSFAVQPGSVLTILGPNGAGKTTLVRMISGMLKPTSGTIEVSGIDVVRSRKSAAFTIGFSLGGDTGLYSRISAIDNVVFFALMYGLSVRDARRSAEKALELVGLSDRGPDKVEHFSRGMKQRLHLARSIVHDPSLLVLDEPSSGLDPDSAEKMRRLVERLRDEGKAILLTTHDMREAEELSTNVLVMKKGSVILDATPADIRRAAASTSGSLVRITFRNTVDLAIFDEAPCISEVFNPTPTTASVRTAEVGTFIAWLTTACQNEIDDISVQSPTLEEVFLDRVRS